MNDNIYYSFFEDLHQIEYSQSSTMKILLIILYYLSSYFMSLTTMFSILILNEHIFKQEKKLKKKRNKINKDICHQSFYEIKLQV